MESSRRTLPASAIAFSHSDSATALYPSRFVPNPRADLAISMLSPLGGSINSVAEDHLTDPGLSCATVFGGTGFVGRRVVRHLRESGTRVRIVSRHHRLGEDDGIEQIAADAHDERSVEAAVAGADGVVNAISLYVEHGRDTFHSVHVETAAKIARTARRAKAGLRRMPGAITANLFRVSQHCFSHHRCPSKDKRSIPTDYDLHWWEGCNWRDACYPQRVIAAGNSFEACKFLADRSIDMNKCARICVLVSYARMDRANAAICMCTIEPIVDKPAPNSSLSLVG